ncbi:MAG: endo-1,4-beta-xylanase, partial [Chloroflexi bacterium]|nr:endo-1,4-beta-xylanase [Chloroflexota bacterium]
MADSQWQIAIFILIVMAACAPNPTPLPIPIITPRQTKTVAPTLISNPSPTISPAPKATVVPTIAQSLRALAFNRGIQIGAAINVDALKKDAQYAATLAREYSALTPENVMKMGPLRPTQTTYKFDDADYLVNFAQTNGMQVRGHTLVWHNQIPKWLSDGNFSREQLIAILREHITTVVARYRGKIAAWDVVNEAIDDKTGNLRETIWSKGIGAEYIEMAFRFARDADPNVKLIYNDYSGEATNKKSDAIYNLVKG